MSQFFPARGAAAAPLGSAHLSGQGDLQRGPVHAFIPVDRRAEDESDVVDLAAIPASRKERDQGQQERSGKSSVHTGHQLS